MNLKDLAVCDRMNEIYAGTMHIITGHVCVIHEQQYYSINHRAPKLMNE